MCFMSAHMCTMFFTYNPFVKEDVGVSLPLGTHSVTRCLSDHFIIVGEPAVSEVLSSHIRIRPVTNVMS